MLVQSVIRVLLAIATGSEDMEVITPADILRRAGAEVIIAASGDSLLITLAQGTIIKADMLLDDVDSEN